MKKIEVTLPVLGEGELHAFSIVKSDGSVEYVILLPGDNDDASWGTQMEWARSIGGDLPDRAELALLYKYLPEQFQKSWYWSNTQHSGYAACAWCQFFRDGDQDFSLKHNKLRARAVRRSLVI
jgi:hypothetical protein